MRNEMSSKKTKVGLGHTGYSWNEIRSVRETRETREKF